MDLMPGSVVPLYHQIYLVLREQWVEGSDEATSLPSEVDLARQFRVSRITMRKALDQLVQEGLISRRRGAGTFVTPKAAERKLAQQRSAGLLDNFIDSALATTVRVIGLERIAPATQIAADLELAPGAQVIKTVRVRSLDQAPVSHITTWVPEEFGACLNAGALASKPMLTLLEEHGVKAEHAQQAITARLADSEVASLLDTPVGAALLFVRRLVRNAKGQPVQLLHGLYRPDRYEYRMDLGRTGDGESQVWYQKGRDRSL